MTEIAEIFFELSDQTKKKMLMSNIPNAIDVHIIYLMRINI